MFQIIRFVQLLPPRQRQQQRQQPQYLKTVHRQQFPQVLKVRRHHLHRLLPRHLHLSQVYCSISVRHVHVKLHLINPCSLEQRALHVYNIIVFKGCLYKFIGAIDGLPHGLVSRALGRSWWDWDLDCWGHTRWVSWWVTLYHTLPTRKMYMRDCSHHTLQTYISFSRCFCRKHFVFNCQRTVMASSYITRSLGMSTTIFANGHSLTNLLTTFLPKHYLDPSIFQYW